MKARSLPEGMTVGVQPPTEICNDKHCPWHGTISLRGRTLVGKVTSTRMVNTISVETSRLHYVPKYKRYEKRRTRIHAHLPACISVSEGDSVRIAETKRLAKTVAFVVLGKIVES